MRILIAARHSPAGNRPIGGVQTWCATVGNELIKQGHEIAYWQPGQSVSGIFDFGIAANYGDTQPVLKMCKKYIVVCHGIIKPEQPPDKCAAFTSEGVRAHWQGDGPIIRQPIDLFFWSPAPSTVKYLTRFSYRYGLDFMPKLAESLGLGYQHVRDLVPGAVRDVLRQSACVLASGRAALEAMACGVPVVLCDHRSTYQGPLMDLDTRGAMRRNYSGRGGVVPTISNVAHAIKFATATGSLRQHVEQYHDVKNIVNELLEAA